MRCQVHRRRCRLALLLRQPTTAACSLYAAEDPALSSPVLCAGNVSSLGNSPFSLVVTIGPDGWLSDFAVMRQRSLRRAGQRSCNML